MKNIIITMLCLLILPPAIIADTVNLKTPKNWNKKVVVIVPAKKYSMEKPLFQKIFAEAFESDFAVVRFNWNFFTKEKEPSDGLKEEKAQLKALLKAIKNHHEIPFKNIIIAAKSFGSQVVAKIDSKLYGNLALITPNCDQLNSFSKRYKHVLNTNKKIQISISVEDPYCSLEQVYSVFPLLNKKHSIYTTYGDHNFNIQKNRENQMVFVKQLINWMKNE